MFDQTAFTISVQAAGGSGSWRLWHYASQNEDTLEDMTKPGFFNAMANHVHPGDALWVNSKKFAGFLVLAIVAPDIVAVPLASAEMPVDAEKTEVQGLPQGTEPAGHTTKSATEITEQYGREDAAETEPAPVG